MKGDVVTDYFRNRKANSLANKRTRLLLHRCQARRRGGSKGSNEPPLKFDNGGLKYK